MAIDKGPGGGVPPDAICVHLPDNPLSFSNKDVLRRRVPYRSVCGEYVKLPPTVSFDGEYLIAKPHERYHGYCTACAETTPMEVRSVIPRAS